MNIAAPNTMHWLSPQHLATLIALLALSQVVDGLKDSLKCPVRVLKGGRVRIRSKGRVAKYVCLRGSQVLGDKYSTCVRGKWDSPVPVCINSGCMAVDVPHGQVLETYRGAIVTVHCDPGYNLIGSQSIYCNGAVWNDTAPTCRETQVKAQKWCDFESEDLCGWTHDLNHDFDWRRHSFATPSGHIGTGPSFDHTLGPGLNGHYMYLEVSSPRLENDTARLFSPVFNSVSDPGACFIFWYHMFGTTTGTLNVYLHKQDTTLLFSKSGDRGDQWLQAIIPLPQITSSFQIVMEGVRGAGYEGDIAIDDVQLTEGQECASPVNTTPSGDETISTEQAESSCADRCFITSTDPTLCECTADCISNNTCCPDFLIKCSTTVKDVPEATIGNIVTTIKLNTVPPVSITRIETSTTVSNIRDTSSTILPYNISVTSIPNNNPLSTNTNKSQTEEHKNNDYAFSNTKSFSNDSYTNVPTTTQLPKSTSVPITNPAPTTKTATSSLKVLTNNAINQSLITTAIPDITTPVIFPVPTIPSFKSTKQMVFPTRLAHATAKSSTKQTTVQFQLNTHHSTPTKMLWISQKPKIEFVTPPPPVVFRQPAKTLRPFTKAVFNVSVVNVRTTPTTQDPKKNFNKTEKAPKSKNDVLHPVWLVSPHLPPLLPPIGHTTETMINKTPIFTHYPTTTQPTTTYPTTTQPTTTQHFRQTDASKKVAETKWKSKYKPRVPDETPVHAQYSTPSSPSGHMIHIIVLVSGVLLLLVTALTTICALRRRKINRRRMEDDELDIQFLASDEILDFTLARPSMEDIQMSETRR